VHTPPPPAARRVARFFLVRHFETGKDVSNGHKIYQSAIKSTKWSHKYQHIPFQGPQKYTQIWYDDTPSGNTEQQSRKVQ
jgi:hypothetical protein